MHAVRAPLITSVEITKVDRRKDINMGEITITCLYKAFLILFSAGGGISACGRAQAEIPITMLESTDQNSEVGQDLKVD